MLLAQFQLQEQKDRAIFAKCAEMSLVPVLLTNKHIGFWVDVYFNDEKQMNEFVDWWITA